MGKNGYSIRTMVILLKITNIFKFQFLMQFLHSTGQQFGQPIAGQREVCASGRANNLNLWRAMEGFFIKAP